MYIKCEKWKGLCKVALGNRNLIVLALIKSALASQPLIYLTVVDTGAQEVSDTSQQVISSFVMGEIQLVTSYCKGHPSTGPYLLFEAGKVAWWHWAVP